MDEAWGLISFELDETADNPDIPPPLIQDALELYNSMGEPHDFCILVQWRVQSSTRFRDYCFSPGAIRACGPLLVHHEITFRQKPKDEQFSSAVGCRPFY